MKLRSVLALCAALARLCAGGAATGHEAITPVARVVGLLKGLQVKLEDDLKAEKDLFERYECWYHTVVNSKTTSNAAATSRIDSLTSYIQDIEAGRIEFTTERVDLEKQIAGLEQDLNASAALRRKESEDYEATVAEMELAIRALSDAIQALQDAAPKGTKAAVLSSLGFRRSLREAVRLSRSFLGARDATMLERIAAGDVPTPDWKKLNRKATFRTKYETETAGIVKTLQNLNNTFTANLLEAQSKEATAQQTYTTLKTSKDGMLAKAKTALVDLVEEGGARALSKSEAQAEVDALREQVTADAGFLTEVEAAYQTRKTEWAAREKLRQHEISGISEAISVLHSDEARDAFTTSYKSQGFALLQERRGGEALEDAQSRARRSAAARSAARVLAVAAASVHDPQLSVLAQKSSASASTRSISAVIQHIDALLEALKGAESTDLSTKESCESQRANSTREARLQSVAIDDLTEEIVRAKAKSDELVAQISEQNETVETLNGTLAAAIEQRAEENAQYLKDKADDEKALQLLGQAIAIVFKLQQDMQSGTTPPPALAQLTGPAPPGPAAGLVAVQARLHVHRAGAANSGGAGQSVASTGQGGSSLTRRSAAVQGQPFEVKAGMAPPPPPATWEDPTYSGASGESGGIAMILALIKEDVESDISSAEADEQEAQADFVKQKQDLESAIQAAKDAVSSYEGEKGTEDQTVVDKTSQRTLKRGELGSTMTEIAALAPNCEFFLVNYAVRLKKRQIEMDGLEKAKMILQGAKLP